MVHLRFEGRSYDLSKANVGLGADLSNAEVRQLLARHLDVGIGRLQDHVVDRRPNGDLIVRPEAVYG